MEIINNVISFGKDHWVDVLAIIGAVDVILGIVVKMTKSTWDDNIYAYIHNFIAKLGKKSA